MKNLKFRTPPKAESSMTKESEDQYCQFTLTDPVPLVGTVYE